VTPFQWLLVLSFVSGALSFTRDYGNSELKRLEEEDEPEEG